MKLIYPVILCGGTGTRLWPLSRRSMPKQFLNFAGEGSLFQQAALRLSGPNFIQPLVITSEDYRFVVAQQLIDINLKANGIMLEPLAKNTAPAILAAATKLYNFDKEAVMLVTPSDHHIPQGQLLADAVMAASPSAENGAIVTFGIQPDRAETGYGYIEKSEELLEMGGCLVKRFHEKPKIKQAKAMLDSGTFLWNSGILLARCDRLLKLAEELVPEMLAKVRQSVGSSQGDLDFIRLEETSWQEIVPNSIDYALMEKADNLVVFPFSGQWSDLGDWQSLKRELYNGDLAIDESNNLLIGNANQVDSQSCMIWADSPEQVVSTVGLKDTIIVAMKDAVLAIDSSQTQAVKQVVDALDKQGFSQAYEQTRQFRPWGWFETLALSESCQVREVYLYPQTQMSMQKHQDRTENWIVTNGIANVKMNDKSFEVFEHQSVSIPAGMVHQLTNSSDKPLLLIEVRTGNVLSEDDVERL